ncbi:hypothetical protein LEP1GSC051_0829 [Leptospira sp. P2653]|nr:hypothetical protein LEP1GSC051_0829 [Leptospira sp. P2653]EMN44970.1 hypothetical protein LEP1GSC086_0157 [Leptospira weilii str. LNT 1234]
MKLVSDSPKLSTVELTLKYAKIQTEPFFGALINFLIDFIIVKSSRELA